MDLPATREHRRRSSGQVVVVFAGAMVALMGMLALVVDVSWYWANTLKVQRAADAAALAGAVYLPGSVSNAYSAALNESAKNGYTNGASVNGGTVFVVPAQDAAYDRRLKVTVTAPVQTFFMRIFGINSITAARDARAEFVLPTQMGSPEDYYGIDALRSETNPGGVSVTRASNGTAISPRGFWGALLMKGSNRTSGDAFSPAYNPYPTANVDFKPDGYDYTVEITGGNGRVWIFDAGFCAVGHGSTGSVAGQYLGTGDHWLGNYSNAYNAASTYFRLWYDEKNTPYDSTDDTLVADSGTTLAGDRAIDRSRDYGGNGQYSDQGAGGPVYTINVGVRDGSGGAGTGANTTLNASASAGASAVSVASNSNIAVGDVLMIEGYSGTYTVAKREFVRVRSVSGGSIGVSPNTLFQHSSGVSVQEVDAAPISAAAVTGQQTVTVSGTGYSTGDVYVNDWVVIDPMDRHAEALKVTAKTATSMTFDRPLLFDHAVDTAIVVDTNTSGATATAGMSGCDQYRNGWYQLAGNLKAGRYHVQATTNDAANLTTNAENMWGVQVADQNGTPRVYGTGAMGAYNNIPAGYQRFYLAKIPADSAGKTVQIDLFDPGDVGGDAYLRILTPNGNAYNYANFSYTADNGKSGNNVNVIQTAIGGSNQYNNSWIRVTIPLLGSYGCSVTTPCLKPSGETEHGWWKVEYQVSGGNDTTTWQVSIRGNPVHLILP